MATLPSQGPLPATNNSELQKKALDVKTVHEEEETEPTAPGEATLLVSEFPPPPYYFRLAASGGLSPPPIPIDALTRGTRRAAAVAERARETERRQRLQSEHPADDTTDAILGGKLPDATEEEEEEGDVVAVFGEIVEDPLQVVPLDDCEDPSLVRDEVQRLHRLVLRTFVHLVQDLVHRPLENKKTRDELSHHIFLMLQECIKFREHQAREILISLLEAQLAERRKLVQEFREVCDKAAAALE